MAFTVETAFDSFIEDDTPGFSFDFIGELTEAELSEIERYGSLGAVKVA